MTRKIDAPSYSAFEPDEFGAGPDLPSRLNDGWHTSAPKPHVFSKNPFDFDVVTSDPDRKMPSPLAPKKP